MNAIFEISTLENPGYQFHQNRTNFRFRSFFGDPSPKRKKSSDLNFDVIFGFKTSEHTCILNFSKIG